MLLGLVEGLATAMSFDPGVFGLAALVGFLLLTIWLIWTGILCILRPAADAQTYVPLTDSKLFPLQAARQDF